MIITTIKTEAFWCGGDCYIVGGYYDGELFCCLEGLEKIFNIEKSARYIYFEVHNQPVKDSIKVRKANLKECIFVGGYTMDTYRIFRQILNEILSTNETDHIYCCVYYE